MAAALSIARVGAKRDGVRRVVGLGASIVQGTISASITDRLAERLGAEYEIVNAGRNGELAYNAAQRVARVVACAPDDVFVLVGSNDVMAARGPREERLYRRWMRLPEKPTPAFYRRSLTGIVDTLRSQTRARIALCSLPFLGEDLDSKTNGTLREYNAIVRDIATERGVGFVDVYAALAAELERAGSTRGRDLPRGLRVLLQAALLRRVLRWRFDRIARRNGFALVTDGIHLTEAAADVVADRVAAWLEQGTRPS